MQRVAGWKFWALVIGLFCAILLAQEVVAVLWPAVGSVAVAQEEAPPAEGATAEAAADAKPAAAKQQSLLAFFFKALGIRYTVAFLLISFTFVAYFVMNLLSLRRDAVCPRHLAAAF